MDVDKATGGDDCDPFRFLPPVAISFGCALLYLATLLAVAKLTFDPRMIASLDVDQDLPRVLMHPGLQNVVPILVRNLPVAGISVAYGYGLYVARRWSDVPSGSGGEDLSLRTRIAAAVLTLIVGGVFARDLYWNAHYLATLAWWSRVDASRFLATAVPHASLEITAYFLPMIVALMAITSAKAFNTKRLVIVTLFATAGLLVFAAAIEATTWSTTLSHVVPSDSVLTPSQP